MLEALSFFDDRQLLIAAGLWLLPSRRNQGDGKYIKFIAYATELKRRKLKWADARTECRAFLKRNPDYFRGSRWEKREVKFESTHPAPGAKEKR